MTAWYADVAMLPSARRSTAIVLGRYIGEGFDDPRLDTLVLAMPIAESGTMTLHAPGCP